MVPYGFSLDCMTKDISHVPLVVTSLGCPIMVAGRRLVVRAQCFWALATAVLIHKYLPALLSGLTSLTNEPLRISLGLRVAVQTSVFMNESNSVSTPIGCTTMPTVTVKMTMTI